MAMPTELQELVCIKPHVTITGKYITSTRTTRGASELLVGLEPIPVSEPHLTLNSDLQTSPELQSFPEQCILVPVHAVPHIHILAHSDICICAKQCHFATNSYW